MRKTRVARWVALVLLVAAIGVVVAALTLSPNMELAVRPTPVSPLLGRVVVEPNPIAIALDSQTKRVFVVSRGSVNNRDQPLGPGTVTVINSETGTVVHTVQVGIDPIAVAADEHISRVFVANRGPIGASGSPSEPGTVSVLDAGSGQVLQSINVGIAPVAIAVAEPTEQVLVVNSRTPSELGSVSILDSPSGTVLGEVEVGIYPSGLVVDSHGNFAFVANFLSNTVSILDLQGMHVVKTVTLGPEPGTVARLALDEQTARLFALSYPPRMSGSGPADGNVWVIDAGRGDLLNTVEVPNPTAMALNAQTGQVLVTSDAGQEGQLTALDGKSGNVLWTAQVGENPDGIGADEGAGILYVLNRNSGTVSVLDAEGGRNRCTSVVGEQPIAIAVERQTHRVFIASAKGNNVSIFRFTC